ncbi:MAG: molybdopterin molybdotransferase [Granulosicoccus sp.]|jgi:molybdopterin molybdotransferase
MNLPPRAECDTDPNAISIKEARARITNTLPLMARHERLNCDLAYGRICAEDVCSPISVPPFRASAMDGYAVRYSETDSDLVILGQSFAGHPGPDSLPAGSCQRITTGARVPDDADAVVQQENTEKVGDSITINKTPARGLNIRLPGSDSQAGALLIRAGTLLGAAQLALLAAHGLEKIQVRTQLHIALFSTGDELAEPQQDLKSGQIYDANRPLLKAMFDCPAIRLTDLGICGDTELDIESMLTKAKDADLIISSGGVSVGDADHVRAVLERSGRVDIWKIAMKPGRPLTFGFSHANQAYFGLPGNPVSAALTGLLFVKPAIRTMLGMPPLEYPPIQLPLSGRISKLPGRVEFQRATMHKGEQERWQVVTTGLQDSHVLTSLHKANCLIELPLESSGANSGDIVQVIPFSHFSDGLL